MQDANNPILNPKIDLWRIYAVMVMCDKQIDEPVAFVSFQHRDTLVDCLNRLICLCDRSAIDRTDRRNHGFDLLVQDLIHAEGEYQNEYGDIFPYGYRVPELKIDSPAARSINVEIDETIGTLARDQLQLIHDGGDEDPMTYLIDWNASLTDGILSLIVEYRDIWWKPKYFVYVYDINRDLRLDNFDLIELFGYSEDDFLASVRDAAGWEYILANEGVPAEYRGEMYDDRYAFTISDENISFENLMIYLESDGRVAVLARIGSMAGAGWYYHVVYPFEAVG